MAQVRKARTIPGFSAAQSAALFREFTQRDAITTELAARDASVEVHEQTVAARAGQFLRVHPGAEGMTVVLPPPDRTVPGSRVTISIESPAGELAVVCVPNQSEGRLRTGTVNGQSRATFTTDGVVELVSNGDDEWSTAAEHPRESAALSADSLDLALDEPFVTWGASSELTNERQAIASTEITPSVSVASVISWVLNTASVAFSKLANLAGLSVLGRASNSSGVMGAITATGPEQVLRSDPTGTSIGFASLLSTQHLVTIAAGTYTPYLLPPDFRHGDTLGVTLTGNVTLNGIRFSDDSSPPEGFIMYVALRDQSGGSAPGWFLDFVDGGMVTDGLFRTPGQVQGTVPGPSYRMQSEEEGSAWVMVKPVGFSGAWRLIAGSAGQALEGDVVVSAGNGSTRTATIANDAVTTVKIINDAVTNPKLRNSVALSVIGRSANSTGDPADISAGTDGHVLRRSGTTLGFGTVAAAGLTDAIVTPAKLAVEASNIAAAFKVRVSFAATGTTGTLIDVTIWNANAPFALRGHVAMLRVSTAVAATTAALRTATGGGGSVVMPDVTAATQTFDTGTTGPKRDNAAATFTVAAGGTLVLRVDRAIAGEVLLECVRT